MFNFMLLKNHPTDLRRTLFTHIWQLDLIPPTDTWKLFYVCRVYGTKTQISNCLYERSC